MSKSESEAKAGLAYETVATSGNVGTFRAVVPGGWLYITVVRSGASVSSVFVPDPDAVSSRDRRDRSS